GLLELAHPGVDPAESFRGLDCGGILPPEVGLVLILNIDVERYRPLPLFGAFMLTGAVGQGREGPRPGPGGQPPPPVPPAGVAKASASAWAISPFRSSGGMRLR